MREVALSSKFNTDEVQEGETIDFEYIFSRYYKRLYNFNYYRTHNQVVSEDLTSQTFEKAMAKIWMYDKEKSSFEVWLFAIARNVVNDYFRSQKKYPWESLDKVMESISVSGSPELKVIEDEERERLIQAVRKLKDKERTMIAYKYGAELKNKEIACLMGIKEKTVSAALCRALRKIKKNLEEGKKYD